MCSVSCGEEASAGFIVCSGGAVSLDDNLSNDMKAKSYKLQFLFIVKYIDKCDRRICVFLSLCVRSVLTLSTKRQKGAPCGIPPSSNVHSHDELVTCRRVRLYLRYRLHLPP